MDKLDWTRFVVRINVNAPLPLLYRAWSSRKGIESWFLRLSEYRRPDGSLLSPEDEVQAGDTYRWLWHGWPDEVDEKGTISVANGIDAISFSFGKAGDCAVTILPYQKECIVQLVQENIPDDEQGRQTWHLGCKTGWTFYLANLKSVFEGGIDLRNRDVALQDMLNK
jgi:hypothetical protein